MTQSISETAVADLVLDKPARSRIFEQQGIDFCCGGKQTLAQACERANADLQRVMAAVEESDLQPENESEADWQQMALGQLADHIVAMHHSFLREELPRIDGLLGRVVAAHAENHPDLHKVQQVFSALGQELSQHMMKEEQVLFPLIHQLETAKASQESCPQFHCGSVNNPIHMMEHEHDNAGNALRQLRELTRDYTPPEGACPTYHAMLDGLKHLEGDLHIHIHKENNFLFPKASELETSLAS